MVLLNPRAVIACDTGKFAFYYVIRTTFVKPWLTLETLYPVFSWGIFEQFASY